MGIPLGGGNKRRRSYADYGPRYQNPRDNDPFRIAFYIAAIIGLGWVYFNQEDVTSQEFLPEIGFLAAGEQGGAAIGARPTATPAVTALDLAAQAEEALSQARIEEAIDFYEQAARLDPANPQYPFEVARLSTYLSLIQYGEEREATLQRAFEASQLAILADPDSPLGYAIEGKVADWQGRPEEAVNSITEAISIDDQWGVAYGYLAEAQIDLQRYEQAQESISTALQLSPQSVDVRRDYGYVLENLGDYPGAAIQFESALAIEPNFTPLQFSLALNYFVTGRYNEAVDILLELGALYPQNALLQYQIGIIYETGIGDQNSALEFYEAAVELDDSYARPWVRIGAIEFFRGNWALTTAPLERALASGADSTAIQYQLGLAYAQRGDCPQALPYLQEAYSRAPEDELVQDIVATGYSLCGQAPPDGLIVPDLEANSGEGTVEGEVVQ